MDKNFKYCPRCRTRIIQINRGKELSCEKCGFYYYRNAAPTVAAILENSKREILLVKRKFPPYKNYWDLPGGFVDDNENLEKALVREVREELNIILDSYGYIGSATDSYPYKGIIYKTIVAVYTSTIEDKITLGDDVVDYCFFPKNNFPNPQFAFPGLAKVVEKYINQNISP